MEGYGGPAQPSPTIAQCINGGLGWLEVECNRCKTRASLPLDAIRRPREMPIWKLEAALKCRSCRKGRYAPPVHMIKLTATQEITPTSGCIRTRRSEALGTMKELSKRDWLFVALSTFVLSGTVFVVLYWLYWMGW
jgi:hypothetical protein